MLGVADSPPTGIGEVLEARAHYAALDAWVPVQAMARVPRWQKIPNDASCANGSPRSSGKGCGWGPFSVDKSA